MKFKENCFKYKCKVQSTRAETNGSTHYKLSYTLLLIHINTPTHTRAHANTRAHIHTLTLTHANTHTFVYTNSLFPNVTWSKTTVNTPKLTEKYNNIGMIVFSCIIYLYIR